MLLDSNPNIHEIQVIVLASALVLASISMLLYKSETLYIYMSICNGYLGRELKNSTTLPISHRVTKTEEFKSGQWIKSLGTYSR